MIRSKVISYSLFILCYFFLLVIFYKQSWAASLAALTIIGVIGVIYLLISLFQKNYKPALAALVSAPIMAAVYLLLF